MDKSPVSSFLSRVIYIFLLVGVAAIIPSALAVIATYPSLYPEVFTFGEVPLIVLGMVVEAALMWCLCRMGNHTKAIQYASFAWLNVIGIYILTTVPTEPVSDYKVIWGIACQMADGSYRASDLSIQAYPYFYNFQNGIAMIESWIIRMFGESFMVLRVLALVALNITAWAVYLFSKRLMSKEAGTIAMVLFVSFYPIVISVGQFSNQHLAAPIIMGIILLIGSKRLRYWCIAGVMSGCLAFIRPMMILTFLTMIVWGIFLLFRYREEWKRITLYCFLFTVCQSAVTHSGDALMHRSDYLPRGSITSSLYPYFKFEKGLLKYDQADWTGISSTEEFNRLERERIFTALKERPAEVGGYAITKMVRYLGEFDYKVENTYNHDKEMWGQPSVKNFILFGWGQYLILGIFALIYLWRNRRGFTLHPWHIFYVGNLYVYFFIEAFSSYRYESYPFLIFMAAAALLHRQNINTAQQSKRRI